MRRAGRSRRAQPSDVAEAQAKRSRSPGEGKGVLSMTNPSRKTSAVMRRPENTFAKIYGRCNLGDLSNVKGGVAFCIACACRVCVCVCGRAMCMCVCLYLFA